MAQQVIVDSFKITGVDINLGPRQGGPLEYALADGWSIVSSSPTLVKDPEGEQYLFVTFVLDKQPSAPRTAVF